MSRLNKFLENFVDEEEKKNSAGAEEQTPDGLIRPVERIRSKRMMEEAEERTPKSSGLKLKLGAKKQAETNAVQVPEKPQVPRRTTPDPIDTADELEELEKLFHKSDTPIEYKERWIVTVRKARVANGVKTMFNAKVCAGKFRFTKEGDMEILPDLDTSGKSSSDIISMDWNISKKVN